MRLNTALVISGIVLLIGLFFDKPYLWIPLTTFGASIVDLIGRGWAMSDRLGSAANLSMLLKFTVSLTMFYAMLGQFASIGLLIWWFVL